MNSFLSFVFDEFAECFTYLLEDSANYFFVYFKRGPGETYPSNFLIKGCSSICVAVILFEGYQRRHYVIKSIPSAGQFAIKVSRAIGAY